MNEQKTLLSHIKDDLHEKVMKFRNTENYINCEDFAIVFDKFHEKDKVFKWIMNGDIDHLKDWYNSNKKLLPLNDWSVRMLREEAKHLKITNYLIMNKGTLANAIKARRAQ